MTDLKDIMKMTSISKALDQVDRDFSVGTSVDQ
jgi:hypothetical protein